MTSQSIPNQKWRFWIDRGGTFTDVVGVSPEDKIQTAKLLSDNPKQYEDAAIEGIRRLLKITSDQPIPADQIDSVKMGTTVATNALLERKGEKTALLITRGLQDVLQIGYQNRPKLFDLQIILPEVLYSEVVEVEERIAFDGEVLQPLNLEKTRSDLFTLYSKGYRSVAIVLMHAYRYPEHEQKIETIATEIGFKQISTSFRTGPLIKLIGRGSTTVADAYLNPVLQDYVGRVKKHLKKTSLFFMQSNSGLTSADTFRGKDAILSGPAGGIVGMVRTAKMAGIEKIIGFDMGGTSTDVSHYSGEFERVFETTVSGVRLRAPMMNIHTVAAGGGSILKYDGMRFTVGPESAGSDPGPACYRNGGPLTVTDCNVMLGNIRPDFFPKVFGETHDQPIDDEKVRKEFENWSRQSGKSPEDVAEGFLQIAVENMANAIRKISVRRGYDVTQYALYCFGGAAAQHACRVADLLEMKTVFSHPLSGVLSAYGMGLADVIEMREASVEKCLTGEETKELQKTFEHTEKECLCKLEEQGIRAQSTTKVRKVHLRYSGTNTEIPVDFASCETMAEAFGEAHQTRFGFRMNDREIIAGTISAEVRGGNEQIEEPDFEKLEQGKTPDSFSTQPVYMRGRYHDTAFYRREHCLPGHIIPSPAVIIEKNSTVVIEPGWQGKINEKTHLILTKSETHIDRKKEDSKTPDPIRLEIFNNLFMSIAEQMGEVLANTSYSVNIKERLDFSCAIFDREGNLIANAPHVPVHLGSMGASVKAVLRNRGKEIFPGDTFMLNDPYNGGTHLPDITLITPVFIDDEMAFFTASRGHHADVGGITPGSMPADSTRLDEEGVLISDLKIVDQNEFRFDEVKACMTKAKYPVRNFQQNIEDLKAQIASNEKGVSELIKAVERFGKAVVFDYVGHIQDHAEESVRRMIQKLRSNRFRLEMDNGCHIQVQISVDTENRSVKIDFSGTSPQHSGNFNAPPSICTAAVIYVFRTLVRENIPMNEGCLRPIELVIPEGSMLRPKYPAAVVAGNVETSQAIVDTLYGALGILGESQGTMNNLTFGNDEYQYYETICGGTGAGESFDGTDAVHSHMTNSLMTDPEILELRYPVILNRFKIREDSGGPGKHKGGNGVIREIQFRKNMELSILSGHRIHAPYGMNGGKPGKPGINRIIRKDGTVENLLSVDKQNLNPDDRVLIKTPGGGGFGKPE